MERRKIMGRNPGVNEAILALTRCAGRPGRNLFMPGDGRYQPKALKPFLGYDQWAGWLIIIEWFWLRALAVMGEMPGEDAELLTSINLKRLFYRITTAMQDEAERSGKGHDILALLALMREYLPQPLHRWLHLCLTSYDTVNTAYALQAKETFKRVFWPQLIRVDALWRERIAENAKVIQQGRTHLQNALPITAGFWLAERHNRFAKVAEAARVQALEIPGKATGAVGTSAAMKVLLKNGWHVSSAMMDLLDLPEAKITTQIAPPEETERFYNELLLLSAALANLGDDARILQSSQFREVTSASSSSSTMAHKRSNPISAEQVAGMHETVKAEFGKVTGTLNSNLQRDLRDSNVRRSYSAIMVYVFQQLLTAERLLKTLAIDAKRCMDNFEEESHLQTGELLHLALQMEGILDSHRIVNEIIVPRAIKRNETLGTAMETFIRQDIPEAEAVKIAWGKVPLDIREMIECPLRHFNIGYAQEIAESETMNALTLWG